MRGVVRVLHPYQRPSLRRSFRNPALLPLNPTLQSYALRYADGSQIRVLLPASLVSERHSSRQIPSKEHPHQLFESVLQGRPMLLQDRSLRDQGHL